MKKGILIILLFLLAMTSAFALDPIASPSERTSPFPNANLVFDGERTVNQSMPMEPYYGYTISQNIYLQSELNIENCAITSISYLYNNNSAWSETAEIYMAHTTKDVFTSATDWETNNLTHVFSGTMTVNTTDPIVTFTLDTPFSYNNIDNLLVLFFSTQDGYTGSNDEFYNYPLAGNRSLNKYNDSENYHATFPSSLPSGTLKAFRPVSGFNLQGLSEEPFFHVSPNSLNFAPQLTNTASTPQTITISNLGIAELGISNIVFSGTNADQFIFTDNNSYPLTLTNGENIAIQVVFSPTMPGEHTAELLITDNLNRNIHTVQLSGLAVQGFNNGQGTVDDPYQINDVDDLIILSNYEYIWDKHFIQTANIDASLTSTLNEGAGFSPIGNTSTKFIGSYDGQGFTISNLYINRPNTSNIALFGQTQGADISNVGLVDNEIYGSYSVGGLVGSSYSSTISNSYASGAVIGNSDVGGFIGSSYSSTISNSYASGTVTGTSYNVGGFIGYSSSSTISNSYASGNVTGTSSNVGGFIGSSSSSTISNSYASGNVTGTSSNVGGFIGSSSSSTISNSYASGNVTGTSSNVGGFIGSSDFSTISNSYASGNVTGTERVGGLVGYAYNSSTISNSYATGTVSGASNYVGGLVGHADNSSTISNSYATGAVSGTSNTGGLVGYFNSNSTINNSYATGNVSGDGYYVGGLVGYSSSSTISNSFWDTETSGTTSSHGGTGKTTAEMKDITTFVNAVWEFGNVWLISPDINSGYPIFSNNYIQNISIPNAIDVSLTPTISFEVAEDFAYYELYFGDTPNPETELVSFSDVTNPIAYTFIEPLEYLTDYYWSLILYDANYETTTFNFSFKTLPSFAGSGTEADPYQIATINDLINISENEMFWDKHFIQIADIDASLTLGLNEGAGFSPIGNSSIKFTGSYDGQNKTISNLYINRASTEYIGLFGYTNGANISNVGIVDNEITGYNHTGSLVGRSDSSTITNSYASGVINGNYRHTGGLVGYAISSSTITNSYAIGDVSGNQQVGGLVGRSDSSTITNSYASGDVSGSSYIGGLVGYGDGTTTNSFWDIETSRRTISAGGTGLTSQAMTSLYTYLNAGWDFLGEDTNGSDDIWHIHPSVNSGYPYIVTDQDDVTNYIPTFAVASYPNDGVTNLATSDNLVWQADFLGLTTGYRLNLGTDNPPTNLVNNQDLGLTTLYNYNNLQANTTYYWQVIPYNANGDAEDCPIWSFTTGSTGLLNVGSGDNTNQALPIDYAIQKSYSQSIYLQSELNLANRDIESLAFYLTGDLITAGANQWKVYLGHTTKTEFASANDWLLANQGLTEVANLTLADTLSAGWLEFQLTAPFAYNNVDNLIVGVIEYSSGMVETPVNFFTVETESNCSLTYGHASAVLNPNIPYAGELSTSIPKINFTFSESTTRFTGLVQNSQNQAIANANVYIEEFGTFPTNALGEFNIHTVEAGTYQLTISAPWHETQSVEFIVLEGQDNYLEITLLEELLPANNLVATLAEDLANVNITWTVPALSRERTTSKEVNMKATKQAFRTSQPTVTYNLYRYELADAENQENWLEVATNLDSLTYTDDSFPTLGLGAYYWAVEVVYPNNRLAQAGLSNEIAKEPYLESSLAELDFGTVYLTNESDYIEIIITNTGTGPLTISDISCDDSAFNLVYDEMDFVLEVNATFTMEVNFAPETPAIYVGELIISNNSSNEANYAVALRGVCEYLPPANPQDVVVTMAGSNANITWDAVTEDIAQNPITPDYYIVYYSGRSTQNEIDFYYLWTTTELNFTHPDVGNHSEFMFYRVKAYIDIDAEVVSNIEALVAQKGQVTQSEIENLIMKSKLKKNSKK